MKKTEKIHWQNGHQIRGGWHHSVALSIGNYAVLICWGRKMSLEIELFELV